MQPTMATLLVILRDSADIDGLENEETHWLTTLADRNATTWGLNHTETYFGVFEEVSKYQVQLSLVERLWAVRINPARAGHAAGSTVANKR
jgi:hypothetical protein